MTTLDPGARVVFTHGLVARPRSTAFLASSAAPIITCGLEVLVQEVIAAITTWPWSTSVSVPSSMTTRVGVEARPEPEPLTAVCGLPASPLPYADGVAGAGARKGSSTPPSTPGGGPRGAAGAGGSSPARG